MRKAVFAALILLFLITSPAAASVVTHRLARKLLGDDALQDNLEAMVDDTELTPRYALKRVKSLQEAVGAIRNQCTKYLYVIKNYISFHQIRKQHALKQLREAQGFGAAGLSQQMSAPAATKPQTAAAPAGDAAAAPEGEAMAGRRRLRATDQGLYEPQLRDYGSIESHEQSFDKLDA